MFFPSLHGFFLGPPAFYHPRRTFGCRKFGNSELIFGVNVCVHGCLYLYAGLAMSWRL